MPKYVVEREIIGVGRLTAAQLHGIAQRSCAMLRRLGSEVQWMQSFITDDKIYCVYIAPDEATVWEHAEQGGFPATRVSRVKAVADPASEET